MSSSTSVSGMADAVVVLDAGPSSLKFAIYRVNGDELRPVARGRVEGLHAAPHFKAADGKGSPLADADISTEVIRVGHSVAFAYLLQWARDEFGGFLSPVAIGHRVMHGGLEFTSPTLLTDEVAEKLNRLTPLAPLHQPHNLAAM